MKPLGVKKVFETAPSINSVVESTYIHTHALLHGEVKFGKNLFDSSKVAKDILEAEML